MNKMLGRSDKSARMKYFWNHSKISRYKQILFPIAMQISRCLISNTNIRPMLLSNMVHVRVLAKIDALKLKAFFNGF